MNTIDAMEDQQVFADPSPILWKKEQQLPRPSYVVRNS